MRTLKTLKPGQSGTKELLRRYGKHLLCVRYRVDDVTGERLKTVELIVQRRSRELWCGQTDGPPARSRAARVRPPIRRARAGTQPTAAASQVALRIAWRETELRRRVKSGGGRWHPGMRLWLLRRDQAERLDLLHRVVGAAGG